MEEILVSICCLAYNHEAYIRDALEGFVNQQTNFRFEVLIHDDASTDRTAEIIRRYEQRYPDIIKPIYQTENQHSKGVAISATIQYPRARGKYIAMCEGDDYWIDPHKLQKQVDYMQAHPDCRLCFTNGLCEQNGVRTRRVIPWMPWNRKAWQPGGGDYDMGQLALLDYVPTASLMFLREDILSRPAFSPGSFTGDMCMRLYPTSLGYAHCIDQDTCVYRYGVPGSSTTQWKHSGEKLVKFLRSLISLLEDMNRLTGYRYDAQLTQVKLRSQCRIHVTLRQRRAAWQKPYRALHWADGPAAFLRYAVSVWLPGVYAGLRNLKAALRRRSERTGA